MSGFSDIGRMVLKVTLTDRLGVHAQYTDVPALVEAFVEEWGFCDIDEVPKDEFWQFVSQNAKPVSG